MESTESLLLSGDRFMLDLDGKKVLLDLTIKGSGEIYRDQRPLCIEGDEKKATRKLIPITLKSEQEAEEEQPQEQSALSGASASCFYRAGDFTAPGQGSFAIQTNQEPTAETVEVGGNQILLTSTSFNATFTVNTPATNPENDEQDTASQYSGNWTFEPLSDELVFDSNLHNEKDPEDPDSSKNFPEFLLSGDMPVLSNDNKFFENSDAKTGKQITVMPQKGGGALEGSGSIYRDGRKLCLENDWNPTEIQAEYCIENHTIGGKGTLFITSLSKDYTPSEITVNETPILTAETKFNAKFEVTEPAKELPDSDPDPISKYYGNGYFAIVRK